MPLGHELSRIFKEINADGQSHEESYQKEHRENGSEPGSRVKIFSSAIILFDEQPVICQYQDQYDRRGPERGVSIKAQTHENTGPEEILKMGSPQAPPEEVKNINQDKRHHDRPESDPRKINVPKRNCQKKT